MNLPKFKDKKSLFDYLVKEKSELISMKKSVIKLTDIIEFNTDSDVIKELTTDFKDDPTSGVIKRSIIGNTYNWLDSHGDVHVGSTFGKSIKERQEKIFHLHDHKHEITAKVGKFDKVYEKSVAWKDLGINKDGETTVLMADSSIKEKMNKAVFDLYLNKEVDQHSVGMVYVKIDLAINDSDYREEKKNWDEVYSTLGNPEKADENGFFWVVKEAKLIEISAVLMGSNEMTPTVQNISEPSKGTQDNEPSKGTQTKNNFSINDIKI